MQRFILIMGVVLGLMLEGCTFNSDTTDYSSDKFLSSGSENVYNKTYSKKYDEGAIEVVFLNPGKYDEKFWLNVSETMLNAADQLGISLEIIYSERNDLLMIKQAVEITERKNKPDFLIISNEKGAGPEMMTLADAAKIKTILIQSDFSLEEKRKFGGPREKYINWIGSIIPDNTIAGYNSGQSLAQTAKEHGVDPIVMLQINGSRRTPASDYREMGLEKYLGEERTIKVDKVIYGEWDEEISYEKVKVYLEQAPSINVVWAANDPMANGVIRAVKEAGRIVGSDIFISGVNWDDSALGKVLDGEMVSTTGGHFLPGGWAMVLLYDYSNGEDFAKFNGADILIDSFKVFDKKEEQNLLPFIENHGWKNIDYKSYS